MVDRTDLDALRLDPDERRQSSGSRTGRVALIVVLLLFFAGYWFWNRSNIPTVRVAMAEATASDPNAPSSVLEASGYVVARRAATVSSKVTGKVSEVLIDEGVEVEAGQVLARLDDEIPRRQLALAESQLAASASRQKETRVRLAEAKRNLERTESLVGSGVASTADRDRDQAEVEALAAQLEAEASDVRVARDAASLRQQELEDTVIRAPFAGVAISKNAQPGEMISPMSSGGFTRTGISTIVDMSSLEIEVDVNESFINRVGPDQGAVATLDAYPDWKIPAHVITIVPAADRQKATVRVRIAFETLDPRILPDMGVKVSFLEASSSESRDGPPGSSPAVRVPREAIRLDGEQDIVWVVANDRLRRQAVRLGRVDERGTEVQAGLAAGQLVMIDGPPTLRDGDRVQVAEE